MNDVTIGTYSMQTDFNLYLPDYVIPAPAPQTKFIQIIGRDGAVDLSEALGIHYDSRKWTLDFKCFAPSTNWHTISSSVMNAIHGKRLNFSFADDPNYFWTGRISVVNYLSKKGEGTLRLEINSDPFKYKKLSTIVTDTVPKGTSYSGNPATFTATASNKITSLVADIDPVQDLHGYSKPWAAGAGKNKLYVPAGSSTVNGTTFAVASDGSVTLTNAPTSNATKLVCTFTLPAGSYIYTSGITEQRDVTVDTFVQKSGTTIARGNNSDSPGNSFTLTEESTLNFDIRVHSGYNPNNLVVKPMIRLSSVSDATWEPYSNICPITGWTGVDIYDDPKYGGTINWNQRTKVDPFVISTSASQGVLIANRSTLTNDNGKLKAVVNSTQTTFGFWTRFEQTNVGDNAGHKIYISVNGLSQHCSDYRRFQWLTQSNGTTVDGTKYLTTETELETIISPSANVGQFVLLCQTNSTPVSTDYFTLDNLQIFDLTQIFGETVADQIYALEQGEAGAGVAHFRNLFPQNQYAFDTGTETCVSAVNGDPYWKKTLDWTSVAGTVYEGSFDPVTGALLSTMANIASYNGETIGEPWLSSMDEYVAGTTPTTGAQVVYTLTTPVEYQLTPQQVQALVGTNNVWADTVAVELFLASPIVLHNSFMPTVPTVTASAPMTLMWGNYTYSMQAGTAVIPQLVLGQGDTNVYVDGTGTISFEYSEGSL